MNKKILVKDFLCLALYYWYEDKELDKNEYFEKLQEIVTYILEKDKKENNYGTKRINADHFGSCANRRH